MIGKVISIVGVGPRGTYAFESLINALKNVKLNTPVTINLIEPNELGAGEVYQTTQPSYLLMNTICSQVTCFSDTPFASNGEENRPTLFEWINSNLRPISPNEYPKRLEHGLYLNYVVETLRQSIIPNLSIIYYHKKVVDIFYGENYKVIKLEDDQLIKTHKVLLTTGNIGLGEVNICKGLFGSDFENKSLLSKIIPNPYPVEKSTEAIKPTDSVGVIGLGLTFIDVVLSLTEGRGGKFESDATGLKYVKSGLEPRILAWSRSGLPLTARGINQKKPTEQHKARFLTIAKIDELKAKHGKLDFNLHILPLIKLEMNYVFDTTGQKDNIIPDSPSIFNWEALENPLNQFNQFSDKSEFKSWLLEYIKNDVAEAKKGNVNSPLKAASDVLRDIRDNIRYAVEFEALTAESQKDFFRYFIPLNNRIAVGPPYFNVEKILALVEIGLLDISFGPNPHLRYDSSKGCIKLCTAYFKTIETAKLSFIIDARVQTSTSELIDRLIFKGMVRTAVNNDYYTNLPLKCIEITRDNHIVKSSGQIDYDITAHGQIAEGTLWYTQVAARPGVNSRSLSDASKWACEMIKFINTKT